MAGYFAYKYFVNKPVSQEEREIARLEKDFNSALDKYGRANRMLAAGSLDVTSDIEDVIGTVEKLEKELATLKEKLTEASSLRKVNELEAKMETFLKDKR